MIGQAQGTIGPQVVLIDEEDKTLVAWVLGMQDCGLSITLQL